jgi:hypothetical protein
MSRKPWLQRWLTLDQRIDMGLPVVMKSIRPEKAYPWGSPYRHSWQHVEACRKYTIGGIRSIAEMNADRIAPQARRKAALNAVAQLRAAREALAAMAKRRHDAEAYLQTLADEIETEARRIPPGRTGVGGARRARVDKARKAACAELAYDLGSADWGGADLGLTTTKDKFLDQLAGLLFEIATGRQASVTKALKAYFKEYGIKALKAPKPLVIDPTWRPKGLLEQKMWAESQKRYAEWNQPPPKARSRHP